MGRKVGKGGEVIGIFADEVMNCREVTGDSHRHRHDDLKVHVETEAVLAGIPVDCEVYRAFSDLLPAFLVEDGGELQHAREHQGKSFR